MQLNFCLGLEEALGEVPGLATGAKTRTAWVEGPRGRPVAAASRIAYQDDTYLFGRASSLAWCLPDVEAALERAGHQLRPTKCSFWAPALDAVADTDLALEPLKILLAKFPRTAGGMTLMGGAVNGELAVHVGAHPIALEPAKARAEQAVRLADKIRAFTVAHPVPETAHVAWMLLAKCLAHALLRCSPGAVLGAQKR